jgi:hypothetical protein
MSTIHIILAGIVAVALLSCTGPVSAQGTGPAPVHPADNSPIGPGNPLFGLKVALENLDETFTVNDTLRVEKQVAHAQTRIEEVQQELVLNQTGYADQALELYWEKLNQTEAALPRLPPDGTGLLHAQEIITRHQTVLADLLSRYPGSTGLARAYNNSQVLEQKFGEKTRAKFDRVVGKDNKTTLKAVKRDTGKPDNAAENITVPAGSTSQGKNESPVRGKNKKTEIPVSPTVTFAPATSGDDKGSSKDPGKKGNT